MTRSSGTKVPSGPQNGRQQRRDDADDVRYQSEPEVLRIGVSPPHEGFIGSYDPGPSYQPASASLAAGATPQLPDVELSGLKSLRGLTPSQALQVIRKAQEMLRAAKMPRGGA